MVCPLQTPFAASKAAARGSRALVLSCTPGQRTSGQVCAASNSSGSSSSISTATISAADVLPSGSSAGTIRVQVNPPRPASAPPSPPSLIHSPVYVQTALIKPSADGPTAGQPTSSASGRRAERGREEEEEQDGKDDNSLVWALRQVDRSLDELEENPLPLQREIYALSRSPVGTATSSAVATAAKVTVAATREAVKAALPVGQWVVKEGAKAAFSLMTRAMAEAAKQQQQREQSGSNGGSGPGIGTTKITVKKGKQ